MKAHLKLRGKALCGAKKKKNSLKFVDEEQEATCKRCLRAVER